VRAFPGGWSQAAADFAPQSLAAPPTQLTHLARIVQAGALTLSTLDHSAIALIEPGGKWPAQEDRDLWWRAFQGPVFEYLTGPGGGVLATECEASDGLHALPGRAVFEMEDGELLVTPLGAEEFAVARLRTGWHVDLLDGPCACGFRGLRLAIGAAPRKVAVAYAG
jgi:phenylacetate-coenzyme A ligase PaaK-like adenylate-forming protein